MAIIPPRRGEFFTPGGEPTIRFITWIENLTLDVNTTVGEVSEVSELISGGSESNELIEGVEADISLITPQIIDEVEVISTSADFTTTGSQIIICTNTASIDITLNANPNDGEQVHIKRQKGGVTVIGNIDGDTRKSIILRYDSPHLIYTIAANEWSII